MAGWLAGLGAGEAGWAGRLAGAGRQTWTWGRTWSLTWRLGAWTWNKPGTWSHSELLLVGIRDTSKIDTKVWALCSEMGAPIFRVWFSARRLNKIDTDVSCGSGADVTSILRLTSVFKVFPGYGPNWTLMDTIWAYIRPIRAKYIPERISGFLKYGPTWALISTIWAYTGPIWTQYGQKWSERL